MTFRIQVDVLDCMDCGNCVDVCPGNPKKGKALTMKHLESQMGEVANWDYLTNNVKSKQDLVDIKANVKNSQFATPLFEFSGACSGCGETPYVKLITQLYGDREMVANATGCSSIYSGSVPSTPYTTNAKGQGPAWANSLFEDFCEFGLGMELANMAERVKEDLINSYNVDIVVGPDAYLDIPNLMGAVEKGEKAINVELSTTETYKDVLPARIGNPISGFISIMSVVLEDTISPVDHFALEKVVKAMPGTKSYEYISKEQALKDHIRDLGEDPQEFLGYNPLLASYEIKLKSDYANPDSASKIEARLKQFLGVKQVMYQKDIVHLVNNNIQKTSFILLGAAIILLFVSIVLLNNTIRISIYSKRFLINTMLVYGMGEKSIREIAQRLENNADISTIRDIPQTAFVVKGKEALNELPEMPTIALLPHDQSASED